MRLPSVIEMSFLLVDQIHEFVSQKHARGSLLVPRNVEEFPLSLIVEAVGQLAAFIGMENAGFSARPVAATAGDVVASHEVEPGDRLDLEVSVSAIRPSAMRYGGTARIGGQLAVELVKCTGAMLPMDAFDEPDAMRAYMAKLQTTGEAARQFPSRAEFTPRVVHESLHGGSRAEAILEAPEQAEFYGDHFPRRPVYPATLLLDAKIRLAQRLAVHTETSRVTLPRIRRVRAVRVRAFTPPGGRVEVVVDQRPSDRTDGVRVFSLDAVSNGAKVSSAMVELG